MATHEASANKSLSTSTALQRQVLACARWRKPVSTLLASAKSIVNKHRIVPHLHRMARGLGADGGLKIAGQALRLRHRESCLHSLYDCF